MLNNSQLLGGNVNNRKDLPDSTCFCLIAKDYTSGQTWANRYTSPADGETQSTYDFWVGQDGTSDSTDPTFSSTYWSVDEGQYFKSKNLTTFINSWHKDSAKFWVALLFDHYGSGNLVYFLSTGSMVSSSAGSGGAGIRFASSGIMNARANNASTNMISDNIAGYNSGSGPLLVIVTVDEANGHFQSFITKRTGITHTDGDAGHDLKSNYESNWVYTSPSTGDAAGGALHIGLRMISADPGDPIKIYGFASGNDYIGDSTDISSLGGDKYKCPPDVRKILEYFRNEYKELSF